MGKKMEKKMEEREKKRKKMKRKRKETRKGKVVEFSFFSIIHHTYTKGVHTPKRCF